MGAVPPSPARDSDIAIQSASMNDQNQRSLQEGARLDPGLKRYVLTSLRLSGPDTMTVEALRPDMRLLGRDETAI